MAILSLVEQHRRSDHRSLGIICKTVQQAQALCHALRAAGVELTLLDYESTSFAGGVVVTTAHISKGLEFDTVDDPQVDAANYTTEMDRCMLYIACTRAMHELHLTHEGPVSRLLEFATECEEIAPAHVG